MINKDVEKKTKQIEALMSMYLAVGLIMVLVSLVEAFIQAWNIGNESFLPVWVDIFLFVLAVIPACIGLANHKSVISNTDPGTTKDAKTKKYTSKLSPSEIKTILGVNIACIILLVLYALLKYAEAFEKVYEWYSRGKQPVVMHPY
jgi:hypothetical protein